VERGIPKVRTLRNQTVRPSQRAAAFYAAKQLGEIQFGGLLSGRNLHHLTSLPNGKRHWDDSLSPSSAGVATHSLSRNIQEVSDESGQTVLQNRKLF